MRLIGRNQPDPHPRVIRRLVPGLLYANLNEVTFAYLVLTGLLYANLNEMTFDHRLLLTGQKTEGRQHKTQVGEVFLISSTHIHACADRALTVC